MAEITADFHQPQEAIAIGLIVGAVIACLFFVGLLTFILVSRRERWVYKRLKKNSDVSNMSPLKPQISNQPGIEESGDLQRRVLIQKSMAIRNSVGSNNDIHPMEDWRADEEPSIGLKEDWKEWEAQLRLDRSKSLRWHPAIHRPTNEQPKNPMESYLLEPGPPSRCHLGSFTFELEHHSRAPTARPASSWLSLLREDAYR